MAKKRKNHLPKRVAGLKVPRILRKGKVGALLTSPLGQAILIEQLLLVGNRIAGSSGRAAPALRRIGEKSLDGLKGAGSETADFGANVSAAFSAAAHAFVETLREEPSFAPPAEADSIVERPSKKSSARSTEQLAAH